MANIDATSSVLGALINGSALATLRVLLERDEVKKPKEELAALIKSQLSDFGYTKQKREALVSQFVWICVLHLLNLIILSVPVIVLVVGPAKLSNYFPTIQPWPLSFTTKIILSVWVVTLGLTYLILCIFPTFNLVKLVRDAGTWLRNKQPKR